MDRSQGSRIDMFMRVLHICERAFCKKGYRLMFNNRKSIGKTKQNYLAWRRMQENDGTSASEPISKRMTKALKNAEVNWRRIVDLELEHLRLLSE